jgi:hypothetical protein
LVLQVVVVCPQSFVFAQPVVDPRALAPLALVDGPLQAAQVGDSIFIDGAFVCDEPDTAHAGVDFAAAVGADSTAGAISQLLGAGHWTRVRRYRQGALAAHAAAEQAVFDKAFSQRERGV